MNIGGPQAPPQRSGGAFLPGIVPAPPGPVPQGILSAPRAAVPKVVIWETKDVNRVETPHLEYHFSGARDREKEMQKLAKVVQHNEVMINHLVVLLETALNSQKPQRGPPSS